MVLKKSVKVVKALRKKFEQVKKRGVLVIKNVPHGFYEVELKKFFTQFGKVTRTRVVRSKRTGVSRGIAYVEFYRPEIAQIAAEAMNNYLIMNHVLKVRAIDPKDNHGCFFIGKNMTQKDYPGKVNRKSFVNGFNQKISVQKEKRDLKKLATKLKNKMDKIRNDGVPDFQFKPVDLPEFLNIDMFA